ncbi:MAG: integration host factor subunit beta [Sphingomonas phyllosphaerae]
MTRSQLKSALMRGNPTLSARDIDAVMTIFFEDITDRLKEGGRVELRGFGSFATRGRQLHAGRNPKTGETIQVEASRRPYFRPSKMMYDRLNVDTFKPIEG